MAEADVGSISSSDSTKLPRPSKPALRDTVSRSTGAASAMVPSSAHATAISSPPRAGGNGGVVTRAARRICGTPAASAMSTRTCAAAGPSHGWLLLGGGAARRWPLSSLPPQLPAASSAAAARPHNTSARFLACVISPPNEGSAPSESKWGDFVPLLARRRSGPR